jgi:hypothetical protein
VRTHSGDVRPEIQPERIVMKRGRVQGVAFTGEREVIGCSTVLCGFGADRAAALLDGEKAPKRLQEAAAIRPACWRYLLHLVAPLDALPDAFGRLAFAVRQRGDGAPVLTDGGALALHLTDGYGQHAVLTACALVTDSSPTSLADLRRRMREHIAEIVPFIDRHLLLVHSPHDGIAPEGVSDAAPPPVEMEPVWDVPKPRLLGICGVPHATGLKGLLLASRQVLPGLGIEGELHAGWSAARLVLQTERKRDVVKGAVLEG